MRRSTGERHCALVLVGGNFSTSATDEADWNLLLAKVQLILETIDRYLRPIDSSARFWLNHSCCIRSETDQKQRIRKKEHTVTPLEEKHSITAIEKVLYTAKAHTTGGRDGGASRTSDGRLEVKLSVPGTPGTGTNPEQLFAVGWSACFLSALKIVAARKKIKLPAEAAVDAEVDLGTTAGGYLIQARLNVNLPGIEREVAQELVDAAHLECPYSKATHGNINVVTNVETKSATNAA
jgi:osmotically inducible protein OsmC